MRRKRGGSLQLWMPPTSERPIICPIPPRRGGLFFLKHAAATPTRVAAQVPHLSKSDVMRMVFG